MTHIFSLRFCYVCALLSLQRETSGFSKSCVKTTVGKILLQLLVQRGVYVIHWKVLTYKTACAVCVCRAGLSYCRHMSKARHRVSHMVKPDVSPSKPAELERPLSREQWEAVKYTTDVSCP